MAKQSEDDTDRASNWSPGRTHWWTTTAVAIIGAIVGGTSLIMNFFYHPSPPPITIDSGHSEFMKLSYADRIDRCVPYISANLDAWRDKWRTALDRFRGLAPKKRPGCRARGLGTPMERARGSSNTHLAVVNYAEKIAPTDEGENLMSCVYAPVLKMDPNNSYPDVEALVGSGDEAPEADNLVVHESPLFDQGEFARCHRRGAAERNRRGDHSAGPEPNRIASWVSRSSAATIKGSACGCSTRQ